MSRVQLLTLLALALAGAVLLGARPALAQKCEKVHDVAITFEFTPKDLVIEQGDCVRWTNIHTIEHSAAGLKWEFNTGQLMPGGRSLITFDKPGEIAYWCAHHPPMQAKLVVKAK
jgi:plastocyanin